MIQVCSIRNLVFSLAVMWSAAGYASNYDFLNNSVVSQYQDSDVDLLLSHIQTALNEGREVTWENQDTGNGGIIRPGEESTYQNMPCRRVYITNKTRTQQANSEFRFCNTGDDVWKIFSE